jgi:hypothetical protein
LHVVTDDVDINSCTLAQQTKSMLVRALGATDLLTETLDTPVCKASWAFCLLSTWIKQNILTSPSKTTMQEALPSS